MELTILKLGGSIITHKYQGGGFDATAVDRLTRELKHGLNQTPQQLILIHGAGGKVHQLAHDLNLKTGAITPEQITGSLKTHLAVRALTDQLLPIFKNYQLPILPLPTNAMFIMENNQPKLVGTKIIKHALKLGLIPLLSGDMVTDNRVNFSIMSGDTVAALLAKEFKAKKIVFASDVDGLHDRDPKQDPTAKLIEQVALNSIDTNTETKSSIDTTNQMLGKIAAIMKDSPGIPVQIINGSVPGRLTQTLTDQPVVGTLIQ